jgi:hypothetical protein
MNILDIVNKALEAEVVAQVTTATATLQSKVTTQATEITALKSTVTARNATIATLETENAALKAEIERLKDGTPVPTNPTPPPDEEPETPVAKTGIWTNLEEIKAIDTAWPEWELVEEIAKRDWQPLVDPDRTDGKNTFLSDLNGQAAGEVVMGAIYYIRTGETWARDKTLKWLDGFTNSARARRLEQDRKQVGAMQAADLMMQAGVKWAGEPAFRAHMLSNVHRSLPKGHSGYDTMYKGAKFQPTINWGRVDRAALITNALYAVNWGTDAEETQGQEWLDMCVKIHKWDIGEPVTLDWKVWVDPDDVIEWYPNDPPLMGVNPRGATVKAKYADGTVRDVNVSGAIPGDLMRGSSKAVWPFVKTGYNGEGGQWLTVCAVMLNRAGLVPFRAGDDALVRMAYFLYGMGEAAENEPVATEYYTGDDTGVTHLINEQADLTGDAKLPEQTETKLFKGTGGAQILSKVRRTLREKEA